MLGATGILVGTIFLTSIFVQTVLGYTALQTGLAFLPLALAMAAAAHSASHLAAVVAARWIAGAGLALTVAGALLLSRSPETAHYMTDLLPGLLLLGFGIGLVFVSVSMTAMSGIPAAARRDGVRLPDDRPRGRGGSRCGDHLRRRRHRRQPRDRCRCRRRVRTRDGGCSSSRSRRRRRGSHEDARDSPGSRCRRSHAPLSQLLARVRRPPWGFPVAQPRSRSVPTTTRTDLLATRWCSRPAMEIPGSRYSTNPVIAPVRTPPTPLASTGSDPGRRGAVMTVTVLAATMPVPLVRAPAQLGRRGPDATRSHRDRQPERGPWWLGRMSRAAHRSGGPDRQLRGQPATRRGVRGDDVCWARRPGRRPAGPARDARADCGAPRVPLDDRRADLPRIGQWLPAAHPDVPEWLRPFSGDVLVATDAQGRHLAGVGIKRHDHLVHELSVGTAPEARGRGLADSWSHKQPHPCCPVGSCRRTYTCPTTRHQLGLRRQLAFRTEAGTPWHWTGLTRREDLPAAENEECSIAPSVPSVTVAAALSASVRAWSQSDRACK